MIFGKQISVTESIQLLRDSIVQSALKKIHCVTKKKTYKKTTYIHLNYIHSHF